MKNATDAPAVPLVRQNAISFALRPGRASCYPEGMADSLPLCAPPPRAGPSRSTRGIRKIARAFMGSARRHRPHELLIKADCDHPYVYRMVQGWACRVRSLPDGRDQFILIFMPGDLFAVKSMFVEQHPDDVRTLSDCLIERLHYRDLLQLYRTDVDIANRCIGR